MIYRTAVASDVIDLIALVQEYCTENNIENDLSSIKRYIDLQLGKIPTIIAAEDDKVVGVISFFTSSHPFKHDVLIGRKLACFVAKDYRSTGVGETLMTKAEDICKEQGAVRFYFSSPKSPKGYKSFETEFYKELK